MLLSGVTTSLIIGMLVAVSLTALFELPKAPFWLQVSCPLLYCAAALFAPSIVVFLPLAAGDLMRLRPLGIRASWLATLILLLVFPWRLDTEIFILIAASGFCFLGCLLSWRTMLIAKQQVSSYDERDKLAKASYELELRNRDLLERHDLERELATLNERSRIAREIHDNVGHLLTRSILQIKALAVVHASDTQLTAELEHVGSTLDSAFETVRKSVHNLHEEASNLQAQLEALALEDEGLVIELEYRSAEPPFRVSAAVLSIVREALSNTQRHSNATTVVVSIIEFPGLYQLVVRDNGSCPPSRVKVGKAGGMGLVSMEERTRALGGTLRTSFDKGFKVLVTIPKEEVVKEERQCAL